MNDGIKITGNWDFDSKQNVDKTDYKSEGLKAGNNKLLKDVNFLDGIDAKEAENIMMAFEDDGLVDFDDFNIDDKDIKQFLSNRGIKNVTDKQVENMKSVVDTIVSTYQEENTVSGTKENYKEVNDIYLTSTTKDVTIEPNKFIEGQVHTVTLMDKKDGVTLDDFINEAYDFNKILGEDADKVDLDGIKHNLVDEYMQSNPELADRVLDLYNEDKPADKQVKNIKDLTYDQITSLNLYSDDITGTKPFKIIAPKFDLPVPKTGSSKIADTEVIQTQYSTEKPNTEVNIVSNLDPDARFVENRYENVEDAIADMYGLDKKDKNYQNAINTIAFQVANDPENKEKIEEYINKKGSGKGFETLDDNARVEALLEMKTAMGLKLPDNVLENDIKFKGNYTYKQGEETYQLSLRSSAEGKELSDFALPATADKTDIHSLEDILKYAYDPRTGDVLKGLDEDGNEVLNIKDQASQGLADAYMLNSIKDNNDIYAAMQEINGELELFGCYEIDEKALKLDKPISEMLADAKDDGKSLEDAAKYVRNQLLKKTNGSVDDFLEKYGKVDLDKAKDIELYDKKGNVRFKDANGNPVTYKVSETYVRFGTAAYKENKKKTTTVNTGTPSNTGVPTGTGIPTSTGTPTSTGIPTGTGVPTGTGTGPTPTGTKPPTETGTNPPPTTTNTMPPIPPTNTGTGVPTSNPNPTVPTEQPTSEPTPPTSTGEPTGGTGEVPGSGTCETGAAGGNDEGNDSVSTGVSTGTGTGNSESDDGGNDAPPAVDNGGNNDAGGGSPAAGDANDGVDAGVSAGGGQVSDDTANDTVSAGAAAASESSSSETRTEAKVEKKSEENQE